ncbi:MULTISPECIES: FtsX-like permease family protein [Bifidobacterium]|uniref:FtsX-like permease family protein n=1 Tax=Bifidobacterium TaxID=1678 RepID=UPI0018DD865F|nr:MULTISPECIES: ABC transporter permease [Bifidobacterium]MBI0145761.1 ABC transporter permease [Bifidobacterium polysaccharolyticum]MBI0152769.1 ABC transporter permease [Bifidobacterium sp. M0399]
MLVLIATQTMVGLLAMMLSSARDLGDLPGMTEQSRTAYQNLMIPFVALLIAAVLIVLQVVSSVINQRRRNLALLALQGATPWQLTSLTCLRVFILALAASLVSLVVSFPLVRPLYAWETSQFLIGKQPFIASYQLASWAAGTTCGVLATMIGTLLTIRTISRISPVESLRAAISPPKAAGPVRRIAAILCLLAASTVMLTPIMQARTIPDEQLVRLHTAAPILPIAMGSTFGFVLMLAAICLAGPSLLGTVTSGWTRLIVLRKPSWLVACRQAGTRMRSLSSTVIPLVVGVSLLMMTDSFYQTSADSSRLLPPNLDVSSSDFSMLITLLGPALVVTLAGVCAGYLVSAHGRSLDLSLISIAGADPNQLEIMSALEGLIMATTAVLISLTSSLLPVFAYAVGFHKVFGAASIGIPWAHWALVYLLLSSAASLASWATVRKSAGRSPAGVIAQYTGE